MNNTTLIVLCAGNSSRFNLAAKKQWLRCEDIPLWLNVTNKLKSYADFEKIIITGHQNELNYMKSFSDDYTFVTGGSTRQESMKNALQEVTTSFVMITDVARSCIPKKVIDDLLLNKNQADCIVPFLNASDTIVYKSETINRDEVKIIQTPQLSNTAILSKALESTSDFTDDSSAIKKIGGTVFYIDGDTQSKKITFGYELKDIECLPAPSCDFFTGTGFDIHPFIDNKQMVLGGVNIDVSYGFKAHSDGDVLIHSLIDALLGAAGAGDIGEFFPDTDEKFKDIDSKLLLAQIVSFIISTGFEIVNIDLTIIAQQPKINPYKNDIKSTLAKILQIPKYKLNIKATTAEKLGFIGRCEGVAVQSSATLKFYDWKNK
ncbi:MAG: bifunctional 2-C-methyl-D-erythritol 4-phosphate cytidylyltransferase/2-C-methyl-D-erythritol 2,4-cyclodiphosphate synthase [Arcobacteraceae bacterium]|nr:bifunctional 2-C-methyl-D-erythritol 4-phosphate cytidylyltransferase/2-C-methyl-D-erythritol 2,4-cyclodiphosphate synthase [Arcobacteraceae bacterium]